MNSKVPPLILDIKSLICRILRSNRFETYNGVHPRAAVGNEEAVQLAVEARDDGEYVEFKLLRKAVAKIAMQTFEEAED